MFLECNGHDTHIKLDYLQAHLQSQQTSQNVHTESERRTNGGTPHERLKIESNAAVAERAPTPEKGQTCFGKECSNRTTDRCVICKRRLCGKCQTKLCETCRTLKTCFSRLFACPLTLAYIVLLDSSLIKRKFGIFYLN